MLTKNGWKNECLGLGPLPVELLERICSVLAAYKDCESHVPAIFNLRLVSREVCNKTYVFFSREAFGSLTVKLDYEGLKRLTEIADWPPFATRVEHICLDCTDLILDMHSFEKLRKQFEQHPLFLEDFLEREREKDRVNTGLDTQAFIERSGADAIKLTLAFSRLPKLRRLTMSVMEGSGSDRSFWQTRNSSTHVFSMMLAAMSHAKKIPFEISMRYNPGDNYSGAVSLQALLVPNEVLTALSKLHTFKIRLETKDDEARYGQNIAQADLKSECAVCLLCYYPTEAAAYFQQTHSFGTTTLQGFSRA